MFAFNRSTPTTSTLNSIIRYYERRSFVRSNRKEGGEGKGGNVGECSTWIWNFSGSGSAFLHWTEKMRLVGGIVDDRGGKKNVYHRPFSPLFASVDAILCLCGFRSTDSRTLLKLFVRRRRIVGFISSYLWLSALILECCHFLKK